MSQPEPPRDPDEVARLIALTELANAESGIFAKVWELLKEWAVKLKRAVFGSSGPPDPQGVPSTVDWFTAQLGPVLAEIEVVWTDGYAGLPEAPEVIPDSQWGVKQAVNAAKNRLVGVPDSVFSTIRAATMTATTEGWSAPDLAAKVQDILDTTGQTSWRNRALTIARTEALTAYNAGKFASFVSYAGSFSGDPFEKVWLATHDHRTRLTHTREGGGDLQRVPLMDNFIIGGHPGMFPGAPELPAGETINCRCSMLLVEPGETVDMSDRHYRSAK